MKPFPSLTPEKTMPNHSNIQQGKNIVLKNITQRFVDELNAENAPPLSKITLEEARAAHAQARTFLY